MSKLMCTAVFCLVFLDWFPFLEDAGLKGIGWQCVTEDVESLWEDVFLPSFSREIATAGGIRMYPAL